MAHQDQPEGATTGAGSAAGQGSEGRLVAENLRLQEALRQAQGATSQFIDLVAHELKQPMTSLKGYTQMLLMGIAGDLTPDQRRFLEIVDANVARMDRLVGDLLEVSRLEAGRIRLEPAPVALGELFDGALAGARAEIEARHHTLEIDLPTDLPPVLGDRQRLVQALGHLVLNACLYTPDGGRVRLSATWQEGAAGRVRQVRLSVSDSGIGLSPAEIRRLGRKFYRADQELVQRQPGNGLGLAITRQVLALHGSELLVESARGRGSSFAFSLPAAG